MSIAIAYTALLVIIPVHQATKRYRLAKANARFIREMRKSIDATKEN